LSAHRHLSLPLFSSHSPPLPPAAGCRLPVPVVRASPPLPSLAASPRRDLAVLMAPRSRRTLQWMATAAATAAARRVAATGRRRTSPLTVKDVEAIVDKKLKMKGIEVGTAHEKWWDMRSAAKNAVTIATSGVVTALMFAYIEKSNELTKKEVMLFIHQRDEAKESSKEVTAEPPQQRKFLGIFRIFRY
ncbi:unnamed protein product, partial [Urochloa humidicola]